MGVFDVIAKLTGSVFQESLKDQIRLESMEDDHTFVMKDGTLMTLVHLHGALRTPGEAEVATLVESMRIALSSYFTAPGHALEFSFMRDSRAARRHLERLVDRSRRAAKNLSLDLDDVFAERASVLPRKMVSETCLIAVYTRPSVLSSDDAKADGKEVGKRMAGVKMQNAQVPGRVMASMLSGHESLVDAITGVLRRGGQMVRVLNVVDALREIRAGLYPDTYPWRDEWTPNLPAWSGLKGPEVNPGKKAIDMAPESPAEMAGMDFSALGTPHFDQQLADEDCFIENSRSVRIGRTVFNSFDMTLAPEVLPDFNSLVRDITAKNSEIPWRISMRIEAGGVQAQQLKALYLAIFSFSAPTWNRRLYDAIKLNQEIHGKEDTVVRMRISFSTWAATGNDELVRRNGQILLGAVRRWGNSMADGISGDPMATTISTIPGITTASTAPVASGPMSDILAMMPLSRQASPWSGGSLLMRTPSGKPWPFQPGSSLQTTWVTLLVGTPGSGKSVFMNAMNFASALAPSIAGGREALLPRIAIIDIGMSSAGTISLLREALPPNKRHLVMHQKLRMTASQSINVFDTHLGMRYPTPADRQFIGNFISLICSDGNTPPSTVMRGLIGAAIDRVYEMFDDERNPRRYLENDEVLVDRMLRDTGFVARDGTTWWHVVDHLMAAGQMHGAEIAQRHAVPTLADLVSAVQSEQVRSVYGSAIDPETSQPMLESFQRMISEIVRDFPILSSHTRYSIGAARIVAVDLMEVTSGGSGPMAEKQTALMYMLARQVLTRDFFLDEADFVTAATNGTLPRIYLEHHRERAKQNLQVPKIICMDEFHRAGSNPAVTNQVTRDGREGRKFNIDIRIASQLPEDFPKSIMDIASGLIVCNAGSESSIAYIDEMIGLTDNEKATIRHNLRGPTSNGAPLWAMLRLKGEGQVRQELNLTLGPVELWAFSTTAEDVALRSLLYSEIGPRMARKVLAMRYPGGSAKSDIETRIARMEEMGERMDESARTDVIGSLVEELKHQSYILLNNEI